jgi:hypothetical protein
MSVEDEKAKLLKTVRLALIYGVPAVLLIWWLVTR